MNISMNTIPRFPSDCWVEVEAEAWLLLRAVQLILTQVFWFHSTTLSELLFADISGVGDCLS